MERRFERNFHGNHYGGYTAEYIKIKFENDKTWVFSTEAFS